MRIVGYVRVSKVAGREGERFISPSDQRQSVAAWAKANRHQIVGWQEDLDQPGTKRDRPGLLAAMGAVRSGQAQGIAVARLDRLGRSVPHLAGIIEELTSLDAALFAVQQGLDSRGATGRLMTTILSAIAEFELDRIAGNWYAARAGAVERGVFVGGTVPLGYRRDDTGRLHPSDKAPLVKALFDRRASGESWATLSRWLGDQTKGAWSVGAVRHLIGNRTYLGEVHGGQGLVNPAAHQPLIDRSTWEAANRTRGIAPARSGRAQGLLAGILRCAGCRYAMKTSMNTSRHGKPFLEYRCKAGRRENAGLCPSPASVSARVIEPFVLKAFFDGIGNYRLRQSDDTAALTDAEAGVLRAEAARNALTERLEEALASDPEHFYALVADRQAALDVARAEVAEIKGRQVSMPATDLGELWPDLTLQDQRRALASALDCVFVRRGEDVDTRTYVCWRGEAPELPVRGRRWTPQPFDFPR